MFVDRRWAGALLAGPLSSEPDAVVLGIVRGGVPVAAAVAQALSSPLDIAVICKVGHPLQRELAVGAVSADGDLYTNENAEMLPEDELRILVDEAMARARLLEVTLRGDRPQVDLEARTAVVVDDGIATSATMMCAIAYAHRKKAARVVCAAPVAPRDSIATLQANCDRVVTLAAVDDPRFAVGRYYADFHQVSDAEVRATLAESV